MQVTAITHRKNAMFTPILVGFPPSDSNLLSCFSRSALIYSYLKYERKLPVEEVYLPQSGGGNAICLIRVSEGISQESVTAVLNAAAEKRLGKYLIAVDADVNVHDPELLVWALSFCTQPKQDFTFLPGGRGGLDPSAAPTRSGYGRVLPAIGDRWSRVAINATRKWPYPPVALPRKEYMDRALEIWRGHKDLPSPHLQQPWYGYTLGDWDGELQKYADLIVQGEYIRVGEEMAKLQQRVSEEMFKDARAKGQ
jgi:4-hydroxy-3-polyprenylbenzoate decarboxylase